MFSITPEGGALRGSRAEWGAGNGSACAGRAFSTAKLGESVFKKPSPPFWTATAGRAVHYSDLERVIEFVVESEFRPEKREVGIIGPEDCKPSLTEKQASFAVDVKPLAVDFSSPGRRGKGEISLAKIEVTKELGLRWSQTKKTRHRSVGGSRCLDVIGFAGFLICRPGGASRSINLRKGFENPL